MRIAIIADPYVPVPPQKYGGTEQVVYNSIKGLIELGHEPVLFAPGDSVVPCELIPTVSRAIGFPNIRSEVAAHERKVTIINRNTEALLRKNLSRLDFIHSHSKPKQGINMRKFRHFPHAITLHGPMLFEELDFFARHSDLNYITISKNQQAAFRGLNYVGVVSNGEDPSDFPIVQTPDDYVCFLGRFDREKNPHLAIQLAISLGIPIKIAGKIDHLGDGYFKEEVEPYLRHPLVEYLGELDFEAKVDLVSRARCNLHPTGFREPFGLTVIEAAYCGTPTLAINKGAMPELIEQERTGLLVEDFIEGYDRLTECFEMDRLYIAKRARTLFNYRTMAEQYVKTFETVLAGYSMQREQNRVLEGLTLRAKQELQNIWQSQPLGHTSLAKKDIIKRLNKLMSTDKNQGRVQP